MEGELSAVVVHAAAVHQAQDVLHGGAVQHLHTTAVSSDQVRCSIEFLCRQTCSIFNSVNPIDNRPYSKLSISVNSLGRRKMEIKMTFKIC